MQVQQIAQLGGETPGVPEVLHAQGAAADLVFIGRANTAPGGADLGTATLLARRFTRYIKSCVETARSKDRPH
jgi:hypothetical protein